MQPYVFSRTGIPAERIIDLIPAGRITSLVGGGGKTSSMLAMGKELAAEGHSVIMTTTTRIRMFEEKLPCGLRCLGQKVENGKLGPLPHPDQLKNECDYLLIEADGSRGLPLKAPRDHEPVITEGTDLVIALVGLTAIGKKIESAGHRLERICGILNKSPEDIVTPEDVATILLSEKGLRKNVGDRRYAVILNQADDDRDRQAGYRIASYLPKNIACALTSYRLDS